AWRDKTTGERREKTEWHRVVIFSEGLCRVVEQYLKKGSKVYLEGSLQTRKYQDKDGQEKYSTEVVLQNFNSTLVMLDRAGGGDFGADEGGASGDFGSSGPSTRQPGLGRGGGKRGDLGDEDPVRSPRQAFWMTIAAAFTAPPPTQQKRPSRQRR